MTDPIKINLIHIIYLVQGLGLELEPGLELGLELVQGLELVLEQVQGLVQGLE